jgi:hypothetical protein
MLFQKVDFKQLHLWEDALRKGKEDVGFWRNVVGVKARQEDKGLFTVLEWGGMEVL